MKIDEMVRHRKTTATETQNIWCSPKINRMKSVTGFNVLLQKHSDALQRRTGFKNVSTELPQNCCYWTHVRPQKWAPNARAWFMVGVKRFVGTMLKINCNMLVCHVLYKSAPSWHKERLSLMPELSRGFLFSSQTIVLQNHLKRLFKKYCTLWSCLNFFLKIVAEVCNCKMRLNIVTL
jgi:hypothetical protein